MQCPSCGRKYEDYYNSTVCEVCGCELVMDTPEKDSKTAITSISMVDPDDEKNIHVDTISIVSNKKNNLFLVGFSCILVLVILVAVALYIKENPTKSARDLSSTSTITNSEQGKKTERKQNNHTEEIDNSISNSSRTVTESNSEHTKAPSITKSNAFENTEQSEEESPSKQQSDETGGINVLVTLNPNGGTISSSPLWVVYNQEYGYLPSPDRENAQFLGWYREGYPGTIVDSSTIVKTTDPHTLIAIWSPMEDISAEDAFKQWEAGTADKSDLQVLVNYVLKYLSSDGTIRYREFSFDPNYDGFTGTIIVYSEPDPLWHSASQLAMDFSEEVLSYFDLGYERYGLFVDDYENEPAIQLAFEK